jgi:pimeloyl-ACP methyl ester carboxylesterase
LPYPDPRLQRFGAPLVFSPRVQRFTWRAVRALTSRDSGLRAMMAPLSTLPTAQWWHQWTPADRASARATFAGIDCGSGFVMDLRQASAAGSRTRRALLHSEACPTLITASRQDGGLAFAHAADFTALIPHSHLVETDAASHFAWLGPSRAAVSAAVGAFLAD